MNFLGNYRTKTLSGLERKRWQRRHQIKSLNAHVHDATDQVEDVARLPMLSAPVVRIVSDLRIPVDRHGVAFHDPFDGRLSRATQPDAHSLPRLATHICDALHRGGRRLQDRERAARTFNRQLDIEPLCPSANGAKTSVYREPKLLNDKSGTVATGSPLSLGSRNVSI